MRVLDSPSALDVTVDRFGGRKDAFPTPMIHPGRNPLGPVRLPPDPFSLLDEALDGHRPSEESYRVAESITIRVGDAPILSEHLESLAVAPTHDLETFRRKRGRIVFAESFVAAASSDQANFMRRRPLDPATRQAYEEFDALAGRVFGAYDDAMNALVFTTQAQPLNHERVTLHELGHAMTLRRAYRTAHLRADLLHQLPRQIDQLLLAYPQGNDRNAIRERVLEALAEAYVWATVGRWQELPAGLFAALQATLSDD